MKLIPTEGIIVAEGDEMAQEYILVKESNEFGQIGISKKVFESIARIEIGEESNRMLPDSSRFKNAVNCKITKDQLILTVDVRLDYNLNVNEECAKLQNKIFQSIKFMTGYDVDVIDVKVTGFIF